MSRNIIQMLEIKVVQADGKDASFLVPFDTALLENNFKITVDLRNFSQSEEEKMTVKDILKNDYEVSKNSYDLTVMVIVVKLPNGAKEVITNHGKEQIEEKMNYYNTAYNDELKLVHNQEIEILSWLFA